MRENIHDAHSVGVQGFFSVGREMGGGGEAPSVFSQLAKRSARVLRESYRRICVLIMRITSKTIDQRF